jgi:hypothetical protein
MTIVLHGGSMTPISSKTRNPKESSTPDQQYKRHIDAFIMSPATIASSPQPNEFNLLVRSVTNTLADHDRQRLMRNEYDDNDNDDDDPIIIPLVEIVYNRSSGTRQLTKTTLPTSSASLMIPPLILAMDWLITSSPPSKRIAKGLALSFLIQNGGRKQKKKKQILDMSIIYNCKPFCL